MQGVVIPSQGGVLVQAAPPSSRVERYSSIGSFVLGGLQLTVGLICIILNIIGVIRFTENRVTFTMFVVGHGFWGGLFFLITGIIGIGAGHVKNKCLIISFMVMSILCASIFVITLVSLDSVSYLIVGITYYPNYGSNYDYKMTARELQHLHLAMLIVTGIELIAAIASSVICCQGVCCNNSVNQGHIIMAQGLNYPGPSVVVQPGVVQAPATFQQGPVQYTGYQGMTAGNHQYPYHQQPNVMHYVPPAGYQYQGQPTGGLQNETQLQANAEGPSDNKAA